MKIYLEGPMGGIGRSVHTFFFFRAVYYNPLTLTCLLN